MPKTIGYIQGIPVIVPDDWETRTLGPNIINIPPERGMKQLMEIPQIPLDIPLGIEVPQLFAEVDATVILPYIKNNKDPDGCFYYMPILIFKKIIVETINYISPKFGRELIVKSESLPEGLDTNLLKFRLSNSEGYVGYKPGLVGFSIKINAKDSIFELCINFYYKESELQAIKKTAISIVCHNYNNFLVIQKYYGLGFLTSINEFNNELINKFKYQFNNVNNDIKLLTFLYDKAPNLVIESLSSNQLISHLSIIASGFLTEIGTNEEKIVLNILNTILLKLFSENNETDSFLSLLITQKVGETTLFENLYQKLDNYGGEDNFTLFLNIVYKAWILSSFSNAENYTYTAPANLGYSQTKLLGFYISSHNFVFNNEYITVYKKKPTVQKIANRAISKAISPIANNFFSDVESIVGSYHVYQPINVETPNQEGEIKLPNTSLPAFFLKGFDETTNAENVEKLAMVVVDVATTLSGIGNLAKLRYLKYLSGLQKVKLTIGIVQLASGTLSLMLNFVSKCNESEFCKKLQTYLFWLDVCSLGADAITEGLLRKSAREALQNANDAVPNEVIGHLKQVVGVLENIKTTINVEKFLASAKRLENILPEDALKYLDEALVHFNHKVLDGVVVQIGNRNCAVVVQMVEEYLATGKINKALASNVMDFTKLEILYNKTGLQLDSLKNFNLLIKDGERGILAGLNYSKPGHVVNFIKENGVIKFIDGQNGKVDKFTTNYDLFKYFKTIKK
jgi:hypothetical protein